MASVASSSVRPSFSNGTANKQHKGNASSSGNKAGDRPSGHAEPPSSVNKKLSR